MDLANGVGLIGGWEELIFLFNFCTHWFGMQRGENSTIELFASLFFSKSFVMRFTTLIALVGLPNRFKL